jgi:hypothetical protein
MEGSQEQREVILLHFAEKTAELLLICKGCIQELDQETTMTKEERRSFRRKLMVELNFLSKITFQLEELRNAPVME